MRGITRLPMQPNTRLLFKWYHNSYLILFYLQSPAVRCHHVFDMTQDIFLMSLDTSTPMRSVPSIRVSGLPFWQVLFVSTHKTLLNVHLNWHFSQETTSGGQHRRRPSCRGGRASPNSARFPRLMTRWPWGPWSGVLFIYLNIQPSV